MMLFLLLFICFFSFTTIHSLAENLDASASMFSPDADNIEDSYFATLLGSDNLVAPQSPDTSIFDDTSLGSSVSESRESLFSKFPGSDDVFSLTSVHPAAALDSVSTASDLLYSTQDIDSKVFLPLSYQWTD